LAANAVSAKKDRPATAIVHDGADARLVVFRIEPGQSVAPHSSTSTVLLSIVSGYGMVSGANDERQVHAGDLVVYEPNELHGMRALEDQFVVLATIAPRPGPATTSATVHSSVAVTPQ
jgi:quercetin dioxygenase-like cupin family protein